MATREIGGRVSPDPMGILRTIWSYAVPENRDSEDAVQECHGQGADWVTADLVDRIKHHLWACDRLLTEAQRAANE